jgi:hypothetical protein
MTGAIEPAQAAEIVNRVVQDFQPQDHGAVSHPHYIDGRGEGAREVRKVKFKLADKRAALMDIAKLFGWITERRDNKIVDEFDTMSDEQIEAWLDERAEARVKMRRLDAATSGQNGRSRRASARSVSSTTASAMAELLE